MTREEAVEVAFAAMMKQAVKTNANHIRSMSDEELTGFLTQAILQHCPCPTKDCEPLCNNCILNWLKQPYKEDGNG